MLKTRAVLWAKLETTYGTDPTPEKTTDAILCEAPEYEVVSRKQERNNVKAYYGTNAPVMIGEAQKIGFTCELKGSGAAGTAPEIGVLLQSCAMTLTTSAGVSNIYTPNSDLEDAQKSCTIWYYQHNILHKLTGCRGTWSLEAKAGEYAKIKFEMTGIFADPADGTMPTDSTYKTTLPPRMISAAFALGSYSAIIENFKVTLGNEIATRVSANEATGILGYFVKERAVTGEIDPEAVALSTWNPWTLWGGSTPGSLSCTFGGTAGNICTVTGPAVMLDTVKYADRENLLTYSTPLIFTPSSGNDEVVLAFT